MAGIREQEPIGTTIPIWFLFGTLKKWHIVLRSSELDELKAEISAKTSFLSVYQKNPTTNQWMDSTEHVQIKYIENELVISTKVLSTLMVLGGFPNSQSPFNFILKFWWLKINFILETLISEQSKAS